MLCAIVRNAGGSYSLAVFIGFLSRLSTERKFYSCAFLFIVLAIIPLHTFGQPPADTIPPVISIQGPDTISIEVFGAYIAPKVTASDDQDGDLSNSVSSSGYVNTFRIGYYGIIYTVSDRAGNIGTAVLTVHVEDTIKPSIKLVGDATQLISVKTHYPDSGVVTADNYQKVLTVDTFGSFYQKFNDPKGFTTDTGAYSIVYRTIDSSGNMAIISRIVHVKDMEAPVITLAGTEDTIVCQFADYRDKGYTVKDNFEADTGLKIDTLGTYTNTLLPGFYTRYYKATDHAGNYSRTEKRTIYVRPAVECANAIGSEKEEGLDLKVYPNPSEGRFTMSLSSPDPVEISIENELGQIMSKASTGSFAGILSFDLSDQPEGIYLLRIRSSRFIISRKLLIAR
jgi:hypothetical protein